MDSIFIGSQLWLTRGESAQAMRSDVRAMLADGLELARVFLTWDSVRGPAGWDFSLWDDFFAVCEQEGMRVAATLSAFADTGRCAFGETPTRAQWEETWDDLAAYIDRVVARYRGSAALDCWILQNEPHIDLKPDALTVPLFQEYLRGAYAPEAFRARYRLADCGQVGWVSPDGRAARVQGVGEPGWSYEPRVDWTAFNRRVLLDRLERVNRRVKALDPLHPTTVNADNLANASPVDGGRDVFGMGAIVDFMGCSAHVSWHSTRFPENKIHQSVALFADVTRAATADAEGRFWMTELQAGANFFSGVRPMCPTERDLEHWLWEALGAGARGVVYWLYAARPSGFEALEWGLTSQTGGPSPRTRATRRVSAFLKEHRALLDGARPRPYDGSILFSMDACVLAHCESNDGAPRSADLDLARNALMVQDARCGAYLLLQDMGLDAGFTFEGDLAGLDPDATPFVVTPNAYALRPEAVEALERYVRAGGTLVADGLFAAKDADGNRAGERAQRAVAALFGGPVEDWRVDSGGVRLRTQEGEELPGWFLTCQWFSVPDGAAVLARDAEGCACAVEHRLGKGRAVYVGTLFFQNYFRAGGEIEAYRGWMARLLPPVRTEYALAQPSPFLRRKVLHAADGDVVVLMNRGAATQAQLDAAQSLTDLGSGERFDGDGGRVCVPMAQDAVRVLFARREK